jgi:hypothetical protein
MQVMNAEKLVELLFMQPNAPVFFTALNADESHPIGQVQYFGNRAVLVATFQKEPLKSHDLLYDLQVHKTKEVEVMVMPGAFEAAEIGGVQYMDGNGSDPSDYWIDLYE